MRIISAIELAKYMTSANIFDIIIGNFAINRSNTSLFCSKFIKAQK